MGILEVEASSTEEDGVIGMGEQDPMNEQMTTPIRIRFSKQQALVTFMANIQRTEG